MSSIWHHYINLAFIYMSVIISICPGYLQISKHLVRILFVKISICVADIQAHGSGYK